MLLVSVKTLLSVYRICGVFKILSTKFIFYVFHALKISILTLVILESLCYGTVVFAAELPEVPV